MINVSPELFARVQSFAEPLVDTFETVMVRALDALAQQNGSKSGSAESVKTYDPAAAPNLSFTTVRSVIVDGKRLPSSETYWNNLLRAVLRKAKSVFSTEAISERLICNHVVGRKEDNGYTFLDDVGISIQATEANKVWKAIYLIANEIQLPIEVEFIWQEHPKAAYAGQAGRFMLPKK